MCVCLVQHHQRKEIQSKAHGVAWQLNVLEIHIKVRRSERQNIDYKTDWLSNLWCHKDFVRF